jgi:hypothetical protein
MLSAAILGATTAESASSAPGSYTGTRPHGAVIILADVKVHLSFSGSDASTSDFLLLTNTYFLGHLQEGEVVSWVKASGESDGTIRITQAN